jgi:tRNA pseudouridine38-40 synthase
MAAVNLKLTISYDGAPYAGWQYQPRQATVQGKIQEAFKRLTGREITVYGAGRTDAGVHALGQVANVPIDHPLPIEKYRDGLNFYLPDDILIREVTVVPLAFRARHDAAYRCYEYRIGLTRSVIGRRRWEINRAPSRATLEAAADILCGEHDFSAFCVVASQKDNNRCLVYQSRWRQETDELIYEITANRFVHTMIRSLVGVMIGEKGKGGTAGKLRSLIAGQDHTAIDRVAPAHGLCLMEVGY